MKNRDYRKEFHKYKLNVKDKGIIKENNLIKLIWRIITKKYVSSNNSSRRGSRGRK